MADVEENSNGDAATAVIRNDIKHLSGDFLEMRDEVRGWRSDHETRLRAVETCTTELKTNQKQLLEAANANAKRGDEKNNIFSLIASITTAAISGAAAVLIAWFGK